MYTVFRFNAMGFTAETERDFVKKDLGPIVKGAYPDIKLMILDDQRVFLPGFAAIVFNDTEARQYVDGIAVHWYVPLSLCTPPAVPACLLACLPVNLAAHFLVGTLTVRSLPPQPSERHPSSFRTCFFCRQRHAQGAHTYTYTHIHTHTHTHTQIS